MSNKGKNPSLKLRFGGNVTKPPSQDLVDVAPPEVDSKIVIGDDSFECNTKDLVEEQELGRGAFGAVYKMRHEPTGTIMAVKRIRATVEKDERRRLLRELHVCMESKQCPFTITFYGALFGDGDVLICMEIMHRSLHEVYKLVYDKLKLRIPELVVGRMAESTLKALHFLKEELKVLHRDVKPSNILINVNGEIKLCDFGIAGELVNSFVQTDIGCKPYLAPERINPTTTGSKYDQKSDVWSFGITMYELAVGRFPYPSWTNVFDQLKSVVEGEAPRIPPDTQLSDDFVDFVHQSLTHSVDKRPKFRDLVQHKFIKFIEAEEVDVSGWYRGIVEKEKDLHP